MDTIVIELHHGGKFFSIPFLYYKGGKTDYLYNINPDNLSYFELLSTLKEDYKYNNVTKMHYIPLGKTFRTLKCIVDDSVIPDMIKDASSSGGLEVYSEYNFEGDVEEPVSQVEQGTDVQEGSEEEQSVEEQSDDDAESGESDESDGFTVNSVDDVSDEELLEVRKKVNELKTKKKTGVQTENAIGDEETGDQIENDVSIEETIPGIEILYPNDLNIENPEDDNDDQSNSEAEGEKEFEFQNDELNSSDYDTPVEDEDEDGLTSVKNYPLFDPTMDMSKQVPVLGMRFSNPAQLKEMLTYYAVENGFPIKFPTNDKKRLLAVCVEGCPWRVWASYMQDEASFQIKSYRSVHKCSRKVRLSVANARWLAKAYGKKIVDNPKWKLKEFKDDVCERFGIQVSYSQCFRARQIALGEIESGLIKHYEKLWSYGAEIKRSNNGSTVRFLSDRTALDQPNYFKRMYVCYDAMKKGWMQGCRPVIGLDGCFLKSFCKGELLSAVGRDGNNQMFPIAWAVVEVECTDSWRWFIDLLIEDIGIHHKGAGWTVITDQQKGLENAIKELIPDAEHRCCARHVYANFRKVHTGAELKTLFWKAAKTGTPEEFWAVMKEIKKVKKSAFTHLEKQQKKCIWSKAFFDARSACDAVENNMSETFNGCIVEARGKPIIQMLEDLRKATMVRLHQKREFIEKMDDFICPNIRKKLEENKVTHRYWRTIFNGETSFEVKQGAVGYVVNMQDRTCSCRSWQLSGIPCCHVVYAIYYMKEDPENYVAKWFWKDTYSKAYQFAIQPQNGENLWPITNYDSFLPPIARRLPGRPQANRRKGLNEESKRSVVSRKGRQMRCTNCLEYGHNKKSCKKERVGSASAGNAAAKGKTVMTNKGSAKPAAKGKQKTTNKESGNTTAKGKEKMPNTTKAKSKEKVVSAGVKDKMPNVVNDKMPKGFGVYISGSTGDSYFKLPGHSRFKNLSNKIGGGSKKGTKTGGSQGSQKSTTSSASVLTRASRKRPLED